LILTEKRLLLLPTDKSRAGVRRESGILIIIIQILFLAACCDAQQKHDSPDLFSSPNRFKFAEFLYNQKDYLRAADEYKEYLKINENDTVLYKYAFSLYSIGRYTEAGDYFKSLFFSRELSDKSKLMFFRSCFDAGDYRFFRELTGESNYLTTKYEREIERLKSISYLFDSAPLPDQINFEASFDDSVQSRIAHFYYQKKNPRTKNPTEAALLSAILPGLGKIYTGEYGDGITSFIATGLSTFLAVSNFQSDHKFRGWLFTGLAVFFYGGNIYGSAVSAQLFNARFRIELDRNMKTYFGERNYFMPRWEN
jgi:tetratricopeptide (TPR) repeat protein